MRAAIYAARRELLEGYRFGDILQSYVLEDLLHHIKDMMLELDVRSDIEELNSDICYIKMLEDITSLAFYKGKCDDRYYLSDTVDRISSCFAATISEIGNLLSTQWSGDLMIVTSDHSDLSFVVPARNICRLLRADYVDYDASVSCGIFSCTILTPQQNDIYNLFDDTDKWCLSATYAIIACLADQE